MYYLFVTFGVCYTLINVAKCEDCNVNCPPGNGTMECAFNAKAKLYKLFPSKCAMAAYSACHKIDFIETPLSFCIKFKMSESRRMYGESCPVFCPNHYRPVCGASKLRDYVYRTFNNGCYLDMLNCRGDEEFSGYVEVPLNFCQNHLMKNIFRGQVVVSNFHDYRDYNN